MEIEVREVKGHGYGQFLISSRPWMQSPMLFQLYTASLATGLVKQEAPSTVICQCL